MQTCGEAVQNVEEEGADAEGANGDEGFDVLLAMGGLWQASQA